MNTYRIWAVQVLHAVKEIEATSLEDARNIARHMYQETGELDPEDIADGDYGVADYDEWIFETRPTNKFQKAKA